VGTFTTSQPFKTEAEARAWADQKIGTQATHNYVLFDDALAQNPRKSGQPRPTQGPPTTPARNLTRDAKGRFTSGKPDDMRLKILTDMANAARSREDQQTNERLSALANR